MPIQDTRQIKEKIINLLKRRGPSLPVHIAKEIDMSILFSSAFLSELLSEKRIKISNMRIGSSPLYYLSGQESQLEKFSQYLKNKEKEAFILLLERKILKDSEQEPAIRVALRQIKDFAIPFEKGDKIYWKFLGTKEEIKTKEREEDSKIEKRIKEPIKENKEELDIFDKEKKEVQKDEGREKKSFKKKVPKNAKVNEKFFNRVKEFLVSKGMEITDIEGFSKSDVILRIKDKGEEKLLIAYNKKRVVDNDILKAHKKAEELKLKYTILSKGEPTKKLSGFIEAIKNLEKLEKIE